jgi:glycosyltransferase involved in cell wall biosynthesis
VVSPRPPRADGQGDQRRAAELVGALAQEWDVDVVSWLPDVERTGARRWLSHPTHLLRAAGLGTVLPAQVAYVQGRAPRSLASTVTRYPAVVFVTDRAVPRRVPPNAVVDFVDDLGGLALRRASSSSPPGALFWRLEGRRLRRLDRRLAAAARLSVAHSAPDAAGIGPSVATIPLSVGTRPVPDAGSKVVFLGNLFYAPNHEAAMWMCSELVPRLRDRGVDPADVVIAGRRPRPALRQAAVEAGVDLRADVADLAAVLAEAAVVLAPMRLGTGAQYKVLDAVGAGRACVVSPVANAGLELKDGTSVLVREREAEAFAEAAVALLDDPSFRRRLADEAQRGLADHRPEAVAERWRAAVRRAITR